MRAQTASDPQTKAELLVLEMAWIKLAHGFEFCQSLEQFIREGAKSKLTDA
jgi:hypothetical protein